MNRKNLQDSCTLLLLLLVEDFGNAGAVCPSAPPSKWPNEARAVCP